MTNNATLFIVLVALLFAADFSEISANTSDTPGYTSSSVGNLYEVTIRPASGKAEIGVMHRWIITVLTARNEPVHPARIAVGGGMPGHGHGLPTQPQIIAYGGDGEYLMDGLRFSMEGLWRLSFVIDSEFGSDRVDFEIPVEF